MANAPVLPVPYQQLQHLRATVAQEWRQIKELIENRNENIDSLKFNHHGRDTVSQEQLDTMYPLDLDLMPLPNCVVAFPFLRLVTVNYNVCSKFLIATCH